MQLYLHEIGIGGYVNSFYILGIFRYISVDDSELFYYFIESQGNPQQDPLFLWLTGGPGCSAFNGLIYEIGMHFSLPPFLFLNMSFGFE